MRQFTITIPEGWALKFAAWVVLGAVVAFGLPWWAVKLDAMRTVESARARVEALQISGQCAQKEVKP